MVTIDRPVETHGLGQLELESGEAIEDCEIAFATHGRLNVRRDNAVLLVSAITSDHHRLDFLIGPGKALDTERCCVIATNALGNGLSTSPSNSTLQPGLRFPRFSIRDMVAAQHRLLRERFDIAKPFAVIGASMGGMQALQWAVGHRGEAGPRAVVALTPMARTAPWAVAVNETARSILRADPGFAEGRVRPETWGAWSNMMRALVSLTPRALAARFDSPAAVVEWLREQQEAWAARGFHPHDYLYQSWAYDRHDVGETPGFGGDLRAALRAVTARTLIMAPPLDLYNPVECAREAADLIPGATFVEIPSDQGHQAANTARAADVAFMNAEIGRFLGEAMRGG